MADPVSFDFASAQRIANAVRRVEIGDRSEAALRFRRELPQQQRKVFRIATFTGAWAVGETKTVEFKYQSATPNTASVLNLFFPHPDAGGATDCAIAKDGTAWFLIDVPLQDVPFETATAVFVSSTATQTVVTDVQIAAVLNTSSCDITVSRTQTTMTVSVVSSTFTSTYLRFEVS